MDEAVLKGFKVRRVDGGARACYISGGGPKMYKSTGTKLNFSGKANVAARKALVKMSHDMEPSGRAYVLDMLNDGWDVGGEG